MTRTFLALLLAGLVASGCGSSTTTPTTPTTTIVLGTELFTGSLSKQGVAFYSFTASTAGNVSVTLIGVTSGTTALPVVVALGFGVPSGTGCGLSTSVKTAPGLTAQITNTSPAGVYCVNVADIGNLAGDVNFTVRIVHP